MTEKLELVKGYDFVADSGTVSLLSGTDGFDVAYRGWTPSGKVERDGIIREAITLRVDGTSTNAIATSLQKLCRSDLKCLSFKTFRALQKLSGFECSSTAKQVSGSLLLHPLTTSLQVRRMIMPCARSITGMNTLLGLIECRGGKIPPLERSLQAQSRSTEERLLILGLTATFRPGWRGL